MDTGVRIAYTCSCGGDDEIQTHDLCNANAALYQLSYVPDTSIIAHFGEKCTKKGERLALFAARCSALGTEVQDRALHF